MTPNPALLWRAEQACFNAWPARRTAFVGDWAVRLSAGPSRRNNSANPLRPDARLDAPTIARIESIFAHAHLPPLFRIPAFLPQADEALDAAGYAPPSTPTRTLLRPHAPLATPVHEVHLTPRPEATWLTTRARLSDGAETADGYATLLAHHAVPTAFATVSADGRPLAVACAALSHHLTILESVAVDPAHHGRRLAQSCCAALIAWGEAAGSEATCLQVQADNAPALRLYARLGFSEDLYAYHYRTK